MSATSNSSFSRFRIEPLDPNSADDIDSAIRVLERAFNGDASEFQRAYYNVPYPPAAERSKSYTKRLAYGLKNGKQAWKVVRNEPGTAEDGVAVGLSVWQLPGVRYRTFESIDKASLSPELRDMYEAVDLEGWNGVYGIMQAKRDELHQGKEH
jgi:hypothetical protein